MSGSTDKQFREQQLNACCEELLPRISRHVDHHFFHGVLAVRDGGDRQGCTLQYLSKLSDKSRVPVIIKTAGSAWHQQGRYGSFISRSPQAGESLSRAFGGEKDQSDQVKLINSGLNSLNEFARETLPQFALDEIQKVVQLATKQGRKVMVHANGRQAVSMAIDAGCHSIEHGFFMGRENLRKMAARQTIWVPTAVTMKALAATLPAEAGKHRKKVAMQNLNHQLEQLSMARQYGVTIALGTDAGTMGVFHGKSVAEEFKLLLKAGYSLSQTVRCATHNGARLLGLGKPGFLLIKGQPANFIVIRATPAMLPEKLSCLEAIYLNGSPCDSKYFLKK